MNDNDIPQNILKTEIDTEKPLVDELAKVSLHPDADTEAEKIWSWAWIFTAFVIGIFVGGLGVWFLKSQVSPSKPSQATSTPTPAATVTVAPTPEAKLERKDLKVQVLNGSGVAGAAGKAKTFLEDLGYTDVATGNADEDNTGATMLSVKVSKKSAVNLVHDDLATKYKVSEQVEELKDSDEFDVVITLGEK